MDGSLTPRQARFVAEYALCANAAEAARRAGYSANGAKVTGCRLLTNPNLQAAIARAKAEEAVRLDLKREDVIAAVLAAVEMARSQSEPAAMVRGLAEIARLCGFYGPGLPDAAALAEETRMRRALEALSDEELRAVAEGRGKQQPI